VVNNFPAHLAGATGAIITAVIACMVFELSSDVVIGATAGAITYVLHVLIRDLDSGLDR